jgi:hypothetical protein
MLSDGQLVQEPLVKTGCAGCGLVSRRHPPSAADVEAHFAEGYHGSDGNYFSKPNREEIFEAVYELMHECDPQSFPVFYGERPSQRRVFW